MTQQLYHRALVACVAVALATGGCGRKPPPPENSTEQAAVDSLVRLHRGSLTAKDPRRAMQDLMCYTGFIMDEFGELRGTELARVAESRAYTWRDRGAERQRDSAIALHVFYTGCAGYNPRPAHRAHADSIYLATHRGH